MQSIAETVRVNEKVDARGLLGRGISTLVVLFMTFDGAAKLAVERHVVTAMAELGWPASQTVGLGLLILACTALYAIPRTSFVGTILLTGFLGGATAAKVRLGVEDGGFLFSVVVGALAWAGLALRDERVRALVTSKAG